MNEDKIVDPGFSPADITDDRPVGEWTSRYTDPVATKKIRQEAAYLASHLAVAVAAVIAIAAISVCVEKEANESDTLDSIRAFGVLQAFSSWVGGLLAGTIYTIKWLYHVVGKGLWNVDRRLWRFFAPHLSGALGLAFVGILRSGLILIVDRQALSSVWMCFGVAFLVGYFSDSATAKMSEVAQTIFGTTSDKKRPRSKKPKTPEAKSEPKP